MNWARTTTEPDPLAQAVLAARRHEGLLADLERLYREVDAESAPLADTCTACGACCAFGSFGHRLYVTTAELARLTLEPLPAPTVAAGPGRCPYQHAGRCTARAGRTLGCRLFFCHSPDAPADHERYERFHARLGRLHQTHGIEYLYADLLEGLSQLHPPSELG